MFRFDNDSLFLKRIEKQDDNLKEKFIHADIAGFKDEYQAYRDEFHNPGDLKKDLHVYDLNADGKNDLIFTGESGGEPREVAFILNTSSGFRVVFKSFQYVWGLDFDHNKISTIYIKDDGCCADYVDFNKIYHVDYTKDEPEFNLTYVSANIHNATFPKRHFSKPIYFQVINNNYKLRSDPVINDKDSVGYGGDMHLGNTIGLLTKGTWGRAIGESKDSTGRVWWFVELEPEANIKESVFYEDEGTKRKAAKMGWISSRYVKLLISKKAELL
ncbi:MAG: hypothetical protein JST19_08550 [Bacteroidetes bacterium]|nr:hypothetical protein [Bacteroidota bacterium]